MGASQSSRRRGIDCRGALENDSFPIVPLCDSFLFIGGIQYLLVLTMKRASHGIDRLLSERIQGGVYADFVGRCDTCTA